MTNLHLIIDCPAGNEKYAKSKRKDEFEECMKKNNSAKHISHIHALGECALPKELGELKKVTERKSGKRLSFREAILYAEENIRGKGAVVICNADIRMDHPTVAACVEIPRKTCWALARWNLDVTMRDGGVRRRRLTLQHNPERAQDAWVLPLPIPKGLHKYIDPSIQLGTPGCDNCIARIFRRIGFSVLNPCLSVIIVHVHEDWDRAVYNSSNVNFAVKHLCVPACEI